MRLPRHRHRIDTESSRKRPVFFQQPRARGGAQTETASLRSRFASGWRLAATTLFWYPDDSLAYGLCGIQVNTGPELDSITHTWPGHNDGHQSMSHAGTDLTRELAGVDNSGSLPG